MYFIVAAEFSLFCQQTFHCCVCSCLVIIMCS